MTDLQTINAFLCSQPIDGPFGSAIGRAIVRIDRAGEHPRVMVDAKTRADAEVLRTGQAWLDLTARDGGATGATVTHPAKETHEQ